MFPLFLLFALFPSQFLSTGGQDSNTLSLLSQETCESGIQFERNPQDCSTYFQCDFGKRILQNCPPTLHWNPDITACDWQENIRSGLCDNSFQLEKPDMEGSGVELYNSKLAQFRECETGSLINNPADCSTFLMCDHGIYILMHCGSGLHWNNKISACDWPSNANCIAEGSDNPPNQNGSSTNSPPEPSTTPPSSTTETVVSTTSTSGGWNSGKKLVCYFTDWAWYRPSPSGKYLPSDIDPTLCTHIVYAFALLNGNDFIPQAADTWADFDNYFYANVTKLKSTGTKVTLALGGWNDSGGRKYSVLVNDPDKRANFIKNIVAYLEKYNFDGLDLDWEYPKCWQGNCNQGPDSDKVAFGQFVKELRTALPTGSILSAAVSANKLFVDAGYDVPILSEYLDWIGVMDYDLHGNWDRVTGHIAPLYFTAGDTQDFLNVDYSIEYWLQSGAAAEKLVMGIPLYGQSFTLASASEHGLNAATYGPGEAGKFTRQGGILSYYEICSQSWNVVQDPSGHMGPYAYNGNQWVSYDDVAMVTKKAQYIQNKGLAGGMIWALDMDDFTNLCRQGKYPLLTAIANTLRN